MQRIFGTIQQTSGSGLGLIHKFGFESPTHCRLIFRLWWSLRSLSAFVFPSPLLAVPNVTAYPSAASVPTRGLANFIFSMWHCIITFTLFKGLTRKRLILGALAMLGRNGPGGVATDCSSTDGGVIGVLDR